MTVAVEVGGRGVGVAGVGVFGARVGGDVGGGLVGAVGDGVWGAPAVAAAEGTGVVATADGLAASAPVAADDATPLVSPQPVTRKTIATSPARQDWCAILGEDAGGARPREVCRSVATRGAALFGAISPRRSPRWRCRRSPGR